MASAKGTLIGSLPSLLECPVCFEICVPPIFQCQNGHVICSVCHGKIKECGICRVKLLSSGIRNLILEKVAEDVEVSCKNSALGCTMQIKLQELSSHGLDCEYGSNIFCVHLVHPGSKCQQVVKKSDLAGHLQDKHDAIQLPSTESTRLNQRLKMAMLKDRKYLFPPICVLREEELFVLQTIVDQNVGGTILWKLILAGSSRKAAKYRTKLTLQSSSPAMNVAKLKWYGSISGVDSLTTELDPNTCFKIPLKLLQSYCQSVDQDVSWIMTVEIVNAVSSEQSEYARRSAEDTVIKHLASEIVIPTTATARVAHIDPNRGQVHFCRCSGCQMKPIVGTRYKCFECTKFYLCFTCKNIRKVHAQHPFTYRN